MTASLSNKEIKIHAFAWLIYIVLLCLTDPFEIKLTIWLVGVPATILMYMVPFYITSLWIMPTFWPVQKIMAIMMIVVQYLLFAAYLFFIDRYLLVWVGSQDIYEGAGLGFFFVDTSSLYLINIQFPAIIFFAYRLTAEKIRLQGERENALITKELNYLKTQFNSHFVSNMLNFVYSKVHECSQEAADAIELFAGIMRYSVTVDPTKEIALTQEINYLKDFITMQKLVNQSLCVSFECQGDLENGKILPRTLIAFVENAFKHGRINDPQKPVNIQLTANGSIHFQIHNKKGKKKNVISTGIGNKNIRHSLDLVYKNRYTLKIQDDQDSYCCNLVIFN